MTHSRAGAGPVTGLTLLGSDPAAGPVSAEQLSAAYPWPSSGPWLRGMMVTTLDGAGSGPDGRSGSISGPLDRLILAEVRRYSDAILIGAGTFRAERYRPQRAGEPAATVRRALGLRPAPTLVLVSRSLDLPWDEDAFSHSADKVVVVTAGSPVRRQRALAEQRARLVVLPGAEVEPADLLAALHREGLRRIVCEGGPRLLATLAGAHLLDEMDLSLSPVMAGGGGLATRPAVTLAPFQLAHVLTGEGFLFTRYVAPGSKARLEQNS
jgi:riboflavin biosynthesis pyrimidine reductase